MAVQTWTNVGVAVQSALATALTITGITKANPGVVTYTGTDPANGDPVLLLVQGMFQLNNRVVRVANVNTGGNTFELEGVDTTSFDTFSSGTASVITYGTTLSTLVDVNASGGDYEYEDVTTIHQATRIKVPTVSSETVMTFGSQWIPDDAGLLALKAASDAKLPRAFKITFGGGAKCFFDGYVGCSMAPTGSALGLVKTNVTITAFGALTTYAS